MLKHAIAVGAAAARARLPELIGETFRPSATHATLPDAGVADPDASPTPPSAAGAPA
jgi:hypothetical protein